MSNDKLCTVDGCTRELRARGWCSTHWSRWRSRGTVELPAPKTVCAVADCSRKPRSSRADYCEKHYYRLRRTGTTADPVRVSGPCSVEDCDVAAFGRDQLCRNHHLRVRRYGSPYIWRLGENHPHWTGDDATSKAVHQRVRKQYGPATRYKCVDCGGKARHWSYDHRCPNEKCDAEKGPYSTDIRRYRPRCVRCHKRYDMAVVMQRRALQERAA